MNVHKTALYTVEWQCDWGEVTEFIPDICSYALIISDSSGEKIDKIVQQKPKIVQK